MDNQILFDILDEYKKRTSKSCLSMTIKKDKEVTPLSNKIGGIPYIPVGEEVPKSKDGKEMALILQVNLKDVHSLWMSDWPSEGILEIFTEDMFNWPNEYAVRLWPEGLLYRTDLTIPEVDSIVTQGYCISLVPGVAEMPVSDYRFASVMSEIIKEKANIDVEPNFMTVTDWLDEFKLGTYFDEKGKEREDDWWHRIDIRNPYLTIGGYADFVQYDIREDNSELTECLFKIDSCYDFNIIDIGDAGIMCGVISLDDLKNGRFEKAEMNWDCG